MAPPEVAMRYEGQKGTATIKTLCQESFWVFKSTNGEHVNAISLTSITDVRFQTLWPKRRTLTFKASGELHVFTSIRSTDNRWRDLVNILSDSIPRRGDDTAEALTTSHPFADDLHQALSTKAPSSPRPATTPAAESKKVPQHLFDLPQELLDIIFGFAYPREVSTTYIAGYEYESRRREQIRTGHSASTAQTFRPKVCDFMVSKRFFREASRAWVGNQHLCDDPDDTWSPRANILTTPLKNSYMSGGIIRAHATKASLRVDARLCAWDLSALPSLLELTLKLGVDAFEAAEPRLAWQVALETENFHSCMKNLGLDKVRGLKRFSLVPGDVRYAKTAAQKKQFKDNVKAWEAFALPLVTRPRLQGHPTTSPRSPFSLLPFPNSKFVATKPMGSRFPMLLPSRDHRAARTLTMDDTPIGVTITASGLTLSPEALRVENLDDVQEFIRNHRSAVLAKMESMVDAKDINGGQTRQQD